MITQSSLFSTPLPTTGPNGKLMQNLWSAIASSLFALCQCVKRGRRAVNFWFPFFLISPKDKSFRHLGCTSVHGI